MAGPVERKTLYLVAQLMPDCTSASLNHAVLQGLRNVPKDLIHTLIVDNGKEFAAFKALEKALDISVYFSHPYSAWERPQKGTTMPESVLNPPNNAPTRVAGRPAVVASGPYGKSRLMGIVGDLAKSARGITGGSYRLFDWGRVSRSFFDWM